VSPTLEAFLKRAADRDQAKCWPFPSAPSKLGYRKTQVNGRPVPAHRAVYERLVGSIPAGMYLDHLCRNPACSNPAHLEPVTHHENQKRSPLTPWNRGIDPALHDRTDLLTSAQAAERLGCSRSRLSQLVRDGEIAPVAQADGPMGVRFFAQADVEHCAATRRIRGAVSA